jgi:hypothetical protein
MLPQCLLGCAAMKLGIALITGAVMLLTGCGVADQYSALPKVFRQPSAEAPPPEPEPDVRNWSAPALIHYLRAIPVLSRSLDLAASRDEVLPCA